MATEMTDKKIEYLAIPYTHEDKYVMDWRAEVSDFVCSELMKEGRIIYAPISSCHHIAKKYGLPRNWEFWAKLDTAFIKASEKIIVITLPGWKTSTGVNAEIKIAEENNIEIEYLDPAEYLEKMDNWEDVV